MIRDKLLESKYIIYQLETMAIDLLTGMRVFAAIVDSGSFARAADSLDLSRGMATRHVAQLESRLGVRLLNRTTRRLSLTEAGGDFYQRATQILALVEEAENAATSSAAVPRGTLRVATSIGFGVWHLDRAVARYLQRHPGVGVEISLSERMVDLVEEGFDVAVRVAAQIDPGHVARRLSRVRTLACASPGYLAKHGVPGSPEDLSEHNCLTYAHRNWQDEWRFRRAGVERRVRISGNLRGNNGNMVVNAAVDGLGVVLEPDFLVYEALRAGQLVRILPDWETDQLFVFAVYPNRKFLPPKVRTFIDFLVEHFEPVPYWDVTEARAARRQR